jgi:hypothetical protein
MDLFSAYYHRLSDGERIACDAWLGQRRVTGAKATIVDLALCSVDFQGSIFVTLIRMAIFLTLLPRVGVVT